MAEELQSTPVGGVQDVWVTLTPGGKGVFDVFADGVLVFSKHKTGRFPHSGEVVRLLHLRAVVRWCTGVALLSIIISVIVNTEVVAADGTLYRLGDTEHRNPTGYIDEKGRVHRYGH